MQPVSLLPFHCSLHSGVYSFIESRVLSDLVRPASALSRSHSWPASHRLSLANGNTRPYTCYLISSSRCRMSRHYDFALQAAESHARDRLSPSTSRNKKRISMIDLSQCSALPPAVPLPLRRSRTSCPAK